MCRPNHPEICGIQTADSIAVHKGDDMATIKINSLTCVKPQDSISEDEIDVLIGGVKVAGTIGVHKGETVTLNLAPRAFTGATTIQLREIDSNSNYDNLGLRSIADRPVSGVSVNFD